MKSKKRKHRQENRARSAAHNLAVQELRRSSASSPHKSKADKLTRSEAKRAEIEQSKGTQ
jgi:hypothetical protein